ncbi:uncharacterized protein LOC134454015 [Engraulis encrasicolus]|uniref:uncharacterized protein LOC134454015 n=1 Tax=Engraulis encrasicolus TaxID=184585 RepID=UPI002FCFF246
MESGRGLAEVIMQLQNEIKKLETENRALRGELRQEGSEGGSGGGGGSGPGEAGDSGGHINLRRNVSAPMLEGQLKESVMMTVRRYSVSSNILNLATRKHEAMPPLWRTDNARSMVSHSSRWSRLQEGVHARPQIALTSPAPVLTSPAPSPAPAREDLSSREKHSNRRSLQHYVNKNRSKVKTVTFLLPVEDIYTNRPVSAKRQSCYEAALMEETSQTHPDDDQLTHTADHQHTHLEEASHTETEDHHQPECEDHWQR